jgi:hypothetical protein
MLLLRIFVINLDYYIRVFKQLKGQRGMLLKVEKNKHAAVSSDDSPAVDVVPSIEQPSSDASAATPLSEDLSPVAKVSNGNVDALQTNVPQLPPGFHFNEPEGYKLVKYLSLELFFSFLWIL